jgi:putative aldouronate transport system permease protein
MLPGFVTILLFRYFPILGNVFAFIDFNPIAGVFGSKWVGLRYFRELFAFEDLTMLLRNTFIISGMRLLFGFPVPIVLAILINDISSSFLKRSVQSTVYLPHFVSWVVVATISIRILSPSGGLINNIISAFGGEPVFFLSRPGLFRWILVGQGIWKEGGWGTVLYLAALSGIDPNLYEAAQIDGAGRWRQVLHVTIPGISSTIVILLILSVGRMINENFQQIFLMMNPLVYEVGDVFETYVYRIGIVGGRFGYATAIGFFKSVVALVMVVGANQVAKKVGQAGLF